MKSAKTIALERIEILMGKAETVFSEDKERADRYASLARKIAMRHALRFPRKWKHKICKKCGSFLMPGANCRVRTHEGKVVITCLECNNRIKLPFYKERKIKRRERQIKI